MDFSDNLFIALRAEDMLDISPPELNETYDDFTESWLHNNIDQKNRDDADKAFDNVVYLAQRVAFYEGMAFERKISSALVQPDSKVSESSERDTDNLIFIQMLIEKAIYGLDLAYSIMSESCGETYTEALESLTDDPEKLSRMEKYSDFATIAADRISEEKDRLQSVVKRLSALLEQ